MIKSQNLEFKNFIISNSNKMVLFNGFPTKRRTKKEKPLALLELFLDCQAVQSQLSLIYTSPSIPTEALYEVMLEPSILMICQLQLLQLWDRHHSFRMTPKSLIGVAFPSHFQQDLPTQARVVNNTSTKIRKMSSQNSPEIHYWRLFH